MASVPLFEKNARFKTGELAEFFGQSSLILVVVEIGKVDGASGLLANGLHHPGMRVAERVHTQAGDEIQIALAFAVEEENSLAALEGDGVAVIGGQQERRSRSMISSVLVIWRRDDSIGVAG